MNQKLTTTQRPYKLKQLGQLAAGLLLGSTLLACSTFSSQKLSSDTAQTDVSDSAEQSLPAEPISKDSLFAMLSAEIAGKRGHFQYALDTYIEQAQSTQNAEVAERATRIGQFISNQPKSLQAAKIWQEIDPESIKANQALAQQAIIMQDYDLALRHLELLMHLSGDSQFDYLVVGAQGLNQQQKQDLLNQISQLTEKYPENAQLWLVKASLEQDLHDYDNALASVEQAIEYQDDYLPAELSKARLLQQNKQLAAGERWLAKLHDKYPKNKTVAVSHARLLIELQQYDDAEQAFINLQNNYPEDHAITLSLGLLLLENEKFSSADKYFSLLLDNPRSQNEANYYLARSAEHQGDKTRAIKHYKKVLLSREAIPAQHNATRLINETKGLVAAREYLAELRLRLPEHKTALLQIEIELLDQAKSFQQAYQLISESLLADPNNTSLRYSRALISEKLDNLSQLEADLRHVIALHPNNAEAINALGYTLVNKTDRVAEAMELIQLAHRLSPENPAILDSLGWGYFRQGDMHKALFYLQSAYKEFPDHEVAAHLGEVLFQMNRQKEAKHIWQKGLQQRPDSDIITTTLQRLNVTLD